MALPRGSNSIFTQIENHGAQLWYILQSISLGNLKKCWFCSEGHPLVIAKQWNEYYIVMGHGMDIIWSLNGLWNGYDIVPKKFITTTPNYYQSHYYYLLRLLLLPIILLFSSVISNPASKIIQTDTSSVILRKHPRFSTIQKVGS